MIDHMIDIVIGYRIPYRDIVEEEMLSIPNCDCPDETKREYCGKCGVKAGMKEETKYKCKLKGIEHPFDIGEEFENEKELFFGTLHSDGNHDYVIGKRVMNFDPKCDDIGVAEIEIIPRTTVDKLIEPYLKKYNIKIDRRKNYGIYLMQHIW